jgi:SAM-dependent methyltransferase
MDRTTCARIASLYDSRLQRGYVMGKLTNDPVYAATVAAIAGTQLPLLDLGCGIGLLGQYLNAQGHRLPYVGLDHDERKIAAGQRAARRAGLEGMMSLHHADAAELPALYGHVALLDVLHYLPAERQPALRCCRRRSDTWHHKAVSSSATCCANRTGVSMSPGWGNFSCAHPAGFPMALSIIRRPANCVVR